MRRGIRKELPNRREISHKNADTIVSNYNKSNAKINRDTTDRMAIHTLISNLVNQGNGRISILNRLQNEFPDSKYSKYFGTWVDDQIEKHQEKNSNVKSIDEGR